MRPAALGLSMLLLVALAPAGLARAEEAPPRAAKATEQESIEQVVMRIARDVGPSVVGILPPRKAGSRGESFRERWWRERGGMPGSRGGDGDWDGPFASGVLVRVPETAGLDGAVVLTCAGAVKKTDTVARIVLQDGREIDARIVGRDARLDLAVLQIDGEAELPTAIALADPQSTRAGDVVVNLGNVFESVTRDRMAAIGRGIVSGIYPMPREPGMVHGRYRGRALETDAPVNPGSYGGPLVDLRGEIVGIVTSSFVRGRRLAVAVPVREILLALPALAKGQLARPFLGLGVVELPGGGLVVEEVIAGGPAAAAGLAVGAELVELDGTKLRFLDELEDAMEHVAPGATVVLVAEDAEGNERAHEVATVVRAVEAERAAPEEPETPDDGEGNERPDDDEEGESPGEGDPPGNGNGNERGGGDR